MIRKYDRKQSGVLCTLPGAKRFRTIGSYLSTITDHGSLHDGPAKIHLILSHVLNLAGL